LLAFSAVNYLTKKQALRKFSVYQPIEGAFAIDSSPPDIRRYCIFTERSKAV
jgi:hypothetical protein